MEDQDSQDEKPNGSSFSGQRCRSSNFSPNEIQTLVNLVAKHKNVVNSKSCNNSALHAKQVAWSRITKMFNSQDFTLNRNMECLKGKWDNLKRVARRLTKNLVDGQNEFDELTTRIVAMICEADNNANNDTAPMDLGDEYNDSNLVNQKELKEDSLKFWDENTEKEDCEKDDSNFETKYRKRINRSINFTPKECRLLLQCVRREKKYVFSKNNSTKFNILKRRAWIRITNNFNKQSEQKRSTSMLLNKLRNMKKLTKKEGVGLPKDNKHSYNNMEDFSHLDSGENQEIKSEPVFNMDEIENDDESEGHEDDITNNNENNFDENSCDDLHSNIERNHINFTPDPLSTILNGDSGLGSLKMDTSESNEITKLKLELLKYQLDNAKLERKRIEDAAQAEAKTNSAREIETALRLRAARLKAVAAALKLAPAHPALLYPPEEIRAQQYLDQYHPT